MAKCFDVVGYKEPCNAVRQKYTGRALLIVANGVPLEFSVEGDGVLLDKIMEKTSFKELLNAIQEAQNISFSPVSIDAESPYPVTIQGNTDSGRAMYTKTIPVSIPSILNTAELFIMGLQKGIEGSQVILVLERNFDGEGLYTGNDVFGAHSPLRLDPTSVTRSEYENGGAWNFNLVCEEPVPNVICTMAGLSLAIDTLNA